MGEEHISVVFLRVHIASEARDQTWAPKVVLACE